MQKLAEVGARIAGLALFLYGIFYLVEYLLRVLAAQFPMALEDSLWLLGTSVFLLALGSSLFAAAQFWVRLVLNSRHPTARGQVKVEHVAVVLIAGFALFLLYEALVSAIILARELAFVAESGDAGTWWRLLIDAMFMPLEFLIYLFFGVYLLRNRWKISTAIVQVGSSLSTRGSTAQTSVD